MKLETRFYGAVALAIFAVLHVYTAMAQATPDTPMRLIVYWQSEVSAISGDAQAMQALADAGAPFGATITPVRRIATGGELLSVEGAVSPEQLEQIAAALARNPHVKSAEVDRRMRPMQPMRATPGDIG
jgi:phage tail tape-measure protein